MYVLGIITGLIVAAMIFAILAFFRAGIEKRVKIIETVLGNAGPKPRGYIFEPEDETDELRGSIIERNKREGKDTPISELM